MFGSDIKELQSRVRCNPIARLRNERVVILTFIGLLGSSNASAALRPSSSNRFFGNDL